MNNINNEFYKIFCKCETFDDLYEYTENMTAKEKGDMFEYVTYFIFKLSPLLNIGLTNIWMYSDIPQHILTKLNLPSKDKGIDLLLEKEKKYYAIQSKFRQNPNTIIKWGELGTFYGLTFGVGEEISGAYFVTNTTDMCNEVNNSKKVKVIKNTFFNNDLPHNFFKNIINTLDNKKELKCVPKSPYKHQQSCIDNVINYFNANTKGYLINACGTGKTLTSYWIDKELDNKLTVFLVPSLYLLSQFAKDIINQSYSENKKIKMLLIGSDNDVDECDDKIDGELDMLTDSTDISNILKKNKIKKIIIVCTYQSSEKLIAGCKLANVIPDFAIYDEAHKTVGQSGKQFNLLLNDANLVIKKRLFMTATEKNYNGKIDDDSVISMNNVSQYGEKIYSYNTGQAINDKILTDYCILSLVCTQNEIETIIKKNKLISYKDIFDETESTYLGTILLLLKKIHDGTINHCLTYHNTINRAQKFSEFLNKIVKLIYPKIEIYIDSFNGSTSMVKRNRIIKEFNMNKFSIICSARVLNEGVNIPIVDSVCFVDERVSTIDIQQCCGRAFRLFEGKQIAYIIIPTFIENLDDAEMDEKHFGNTIRIIKSMKNTDDDLVDYFRLENEVTKKCIRKIVKFEHIGKLKKSEEIKFDTWCNNVNGKISKIINVGEYKYDLLFKFVNEKKKVPSRDEEYEGVKLGQFYGYLKKSVNSTLSNMYLKLSCDKIIYDDLNNFLTKKINKISIEQKLEVLLEFVDYNLRVPLWNEEYKNIKIGDFYRHQKNRLSDTSDMYSILMNNSIIKNDLEEFFKKKNDGSIIDKKVNLLFKFVSEKDRVPTCREIYENIKLGGFYNGQKERITTKSKIYSTLSKNKILKNDIDNYLASKELRKLTPNTQPTNDEKINLLEEYVDKYKKVPILSEIYKDFKLGQFYSGIKQRIITNTSNMYIKLSKNSILKTNIDEYLVEREQNKNKHELTLEDKINLLFNFVNTAGKVPTCRELHEEFKLGKFYFYHKDRIQSYSSEMYLKLSKNNIIKLNLDEYLKSKIKIENVNHSKLH